MSHPRSTISRAAVPSDRKDSMKQQRRRTGSGADNPPLNKRAKVRTEADTIMTVEGAPLKKAKMRLKKDKAGEDEDDADTVIINRAPVLTLWVAVVAETLGHSWNTAMTIGKYIAGVFAQSKGRSIGLFEPTERNLISRQAREKCKGEHKEVHVLGRKVTVTVPHDGSDPVAISAGREIAAASVHQYLLTKFGNNLQRTKEAMKELANALNSQDPENLQQRAYDMYTAFRPEVPEGLKGWGKKGRVRLARIRELTETL